MKVASILKKKGREVHTIHPEQKVAEAVEILVQQRIGALVVVDAAGRPVSIISERDVLRALHHHCSRMAEFEVRELMAEQMVACVSSDSVDDVMHLMNHNVTGRRIRHIPVVDDGELIGMVTLGDIIEALLTEREFENNLLRNYIKNWPEEE